MSGMGKFRRQVNNFYRKLEGRFRRFLLIFFIASIYFTVLYKRQNLGMTPLMPIRLIDQIIDGRKIVIKHTRVPIQHISNNMIYGVLAGEDQKFLDHFGFDGDALFKALIHNINTNSLGLGGSTITQQTAKNVFLRPGRSIVRKGLETYFTLLMEIGRSKQRIIEIYLNIIEFGDGIYGVEQAAQYYFTTSAANLTQNQSSFLVAIMPNPRYYQLHKNGYQVSRRKSVISRNISSMKRNKEIKIFVESTKK